MLKMIESRRIDKIAMSLAGLIVIVSVVISDLTLRQFSSLLSVICLTGLLWRALSSLGQMDRLSRALATVVGGSLLAGAIAQFLLEQQVTAMPAEIDRADLPTNTVGVWLIIASRLLILVVIVFWDRWLNQYRGILSEGLPPFQDK